MSTANTFEREMLALINQERTSRGLDSLMLETRLNDSSEDHTTWMLESDTFDHTGQGGSSATQRIEDAGFDLEGNWRTGENIAWQSERGAPGISDDVAQLHQSLMNSPGHRANILNPDFDYIGIGIEEGDFRGWDSVMVTQNFGSTAAEVVLDTGDAPVPPTDEVAEPTDPVVEDPDTDVVEDPETDVVETEDPVSDTPDTDVTETEEPETPDTDVTETEDPDAETPETEDPGTETPDTDVTETEDPMPEEPDTDVTETEDPDTDTTDPEVVDTDMPDDGCFDVAAFLAEIELFVDSLKARLDQFAWDDGEMTPEDPAGDDFDLVMDNEPEEIDGMAGCGDVTNDDTGDFFVVNFFNFDCMMDAA